MDWMRKRLIKIFICIFIAIIPAYAVASDEYLGDKECFTCHRNIKKIYLSDIHGKIFTTNPRNSLEERGCEACHGSGKEHKIIADDMDYKGPLKIEAFKKDGGASCERDRGCLSCHEREQQRHWQGSMHEMADLSCVDCHQIHSVERMNGTDVCLSCHTQKRAQLQRSSHMPLREGKMTCVSCHNPHGSLYPSLLKQASVNENCYTCHAEKRGPLI